MVFAIRAMTVERGLDPREFVVFSYGGGGGLFAAAVAEELEMPTVLVPRAPANFSAWGILTSDYREDVAVTTRAAPRRVLGRRGSRGPPAARRRSRPPTSSATASPRAERRADLSRRHPLRRPGPHDHRAARARVARRPSPRCSPARGERFVAAHIQLYGHGTLDAAARAGHEPRTCGRPRRASVRGRTGDARARPPPDDPRRCTSGARGRDRDARPRPRDASRPASRPGDRRGVDDDSRRAARLVARTPTGSATCCSRESR